MQTLISSFVLTLIVIKLLNERRDYAIALFLNESHVSQWDFQSNLHVYYMYVKDELGKRLDLRKNQSDQIIDGQIANACTKRLFNYNYTYIHNSSDKALV